MHDFRVPKPSDVYDGIEKDFEILWKVSCNFSMINSRKYSAELCTEMKAENTELRKHMTDEVFECLCKGEKIDPHWTKAITKELFQNNIIIPKGKRRIYSDIGITHPIQVKNINNRHYLIRQKSASGDGFMFPNLLLFFTTKGIRLAPLPRLILLPIVAIIIIGASIQSGGLNKEIVWIALLFILGIQLVSIPIIYTTTPQKLLELLEKLDDKRKAESKL